MAKCCGMPPQQQLTLLTCHTSLQALYSDRNAVSQKAQLFYII